MTRGASRYGGRLIEILRPARAPFSLGAWCHVSVLRCLRALKSLDCYSHSHCCRALLRRRVFEARPRHCRVSRATTTPTDLPPVTAAERWACRRSAAALACGICDPRRERAHCGGFWRGLPRGHAADAVGLAQHTGLPRCRVQPQLRHRRGAGREGAAAARRKCPCAASPASCARKSPRWAAPGRCRPHGFAAPALRRQRPGAAPVRLGI